MDKITFGALALLFCMLFASTASASAGNWTIDGDSVYINDSKAYISASPHTIHESQYVYFNISSKNYTGNIDMAFGFDIDKVKPKTAELYKPQTVRLPDTFSEKIFYYVTNITTTSLYPEYGNEYNTYRRQIQHKLPVGYDNSTNSTIWSNLTSIVAFDSYSQSGQNYTINWSTRNYQNTTWTSIADRFDSISWDYDGFNKWYYSTNLPIIAGNYYNLRVWMEVPVSLTPTSGKYGFAIKPSSQTLEQAKTTGNLYYLDPWFDSSWGKRAPIFINNTGNATTLINYQVNLNVTYDSDMNANFSDLRIVNDTSGLEIPFWNETIVNGNYANLWFNATNIPASIWTNNTYFLYYKNPKATSASNAGATFIREISNVSGAWDFNGDTVDRSGNGNNGTFAGTVNYSNNGKYGKSIYLNGASYISIPDSGSLRIGIGEASYGGWVNASTAGMVYQKRYVSGSTFQDYAMDITSGGALDAYIDNRPTYGYIQHNSGGNYFNKLKYFMIVLRRNATSTISDIYIDGTFINTESINFLLDPLNPNNVLLGKDSSNNNFLTASIEHYRLYKKALTSSEILDLYNNFGYVTPNYAGKELVRKYTAIEPTAILGTEETVRYVSPVPVNLIYTTAAIANTTVPSDNMKYSNNSADYYDSRPYTLVKSITITQKITGTQRFSSSGIIHTCNTNIYAKVYKNGVPIGTTNTGYNMGSFVEDITQNWNVGDTLELWGNSDFCNIGWNNFQMSYDGTAWVNYTWSAGAGNFSNSYNVSIGGTWYNGTTTPYKNITLAAHANADAIIYAFNSSGTGTLSTTAATQSNTIANNLPVMISNSITPTTAYTADTLSSSTLSASDADMDLVTYTYQWYENNISMSGRTSSTLDPQYTTKGNAYKVLVTPNDGYGSGTATYSNSVTILNTAPTAPIMTSNLGLNEINNFPTITFTKGTDADGDTVTTYVYADTNTTPTTLETTTTGTTALLGNTTALIDNGTYYVRLQSYDGTTWNNTFSTTDTFRMNSPPTVPVLSTPANGINSLIANQTLDWINSTDAQGDNITYNLSVNGSVISTGLTISQAILETAYGAYNWTVQAYDGYESSAWAGLFHFNNNNDSFVFSEKTLSETVIATSTGSTTISLKIISPVGNITSAQIEITYVGTQNYYPMTNGTNNTWSYIFKTGSPGTYTITGFQATDNLNATNTTTWNQQIVVIPISAGGSSGGGGGGGGSTGTSSGTPTPAATTTVIDLPSADIPNINLRSMGETPGGATILYLTTIGGIGMMIMGAASKRFTTSTMVWGLIVLIGSLYGLGVIN